MLSLHQRPPTQGAFDAFMPNPALRGARCMDEASMAIERTPTAFELSDDESHDDSMMMDAYVCVYMYMYICFCIVEYRS